MTRLETSIRNSSSQKPTFPSASRTPHMQHCRRLSRAQHDLSSISEVPIPLSTLLWRVGHLQKPLRAISDDQEEEI